VVERETPGDFGYQWNDPSDVDGLTADAAPEQETPEEFDYLLSSTDEAQWHDSGDNLRRNNGEPDDGHFDAFKADTWNFTPPPIPWYRGTQAMTAVVAAAAALVAIVVSGVLLVFRGSNSTVDHPTPVSQTETATATSAAPTTVDSRVELPPPAPPPPPPPESVAPSVNTAPTYSPPRVEQPATKEPEIGVTRTPITRAPLSVAPQPRRAPPAPPTGSHHG
jgi:hypothetical protein